MEYIYICICIYTCTFLNWSERKKEKFISTAKLDWYTSLTFEVAEGESVNSPKSPS